MRLRSLLPVAALLGVASRVAAQTPAAYHVWVASEATDRLFAIDFDGQAARIRDQYDVGINPTDPDGPHGLGLSPDGRFLYVSTAHGVPFGSQWKFAALTGSRASGR